MASHDCVYGVKEPKWKKTGGNSVRKRPCSHELFSNNYKVTLQRTDTCIVQSVMTVAGYTEPIRGTHLYSNVGQTLINIIRHNWSLINYNRWKKKRKKKWKICSHKYVLRFVFILFGRHRGKVQIYNNNNLYILQSAQSTIDMRFVAFDKTIYTPSGLSK